jgi:hypothetical protein
MFDEQRNSNSLHGIYSNISQKTDRGCNITLDKAQFKMLHRKEMGPCLQRILLCASVLSSFLKLGYPA